LKICIEQYKILWLEIAVFRHSRRHSLVAIALVRLKALVRVIPIGGARSVACLVRASALSFPKTPEWLGHHEMTVESWVTDSQKDAE